MALPLALLLSSPSIASAQFKAPVIPAGTCPSAEPLAMPDASPLVEAVVAQLGSSGALEVGAAGDHVARTFVGEVCTSADVKASLPVTCATPPDQRVLVELRRRLVVDAVRVPSVWIGRRLAELPPGARMSARLGVGLLDAALQGASLERLGASLAGEGWACARRELPAVDLAPRAAGEHLTQEARVRLEQEMRERLDEEAQRLGLPPADARVEAIGRLLLAIAKNPEAGVEPLRQALRQELVRQGRIVADAALAEGHVVADAALSEARLRAEGELLAVVPALAKEQRRLRAIASSAEASVRAAQVVALTTLLARSVEASASYLFEGQLPALGPYVTLVEVIARGDLAEVIPRLTAVFPVEVKLDERETRTLRTLGVGLRLLRARDAQEARRILQSLLLGPWSEPWMVDIDGLALSVSDRGTRFGGHALLGYHGESFGLTAQGRLSSYDLDDGRVIARTDRASGGLDGWLSHHTPAIHLDLRFSGDVARYRTTRIDRESAASETFFFQERSILARGSLLAGLRVEPTTSFALGLWLGGGVQYERHKPLSLGASEGISLATASTTQARFQGRLRAQAALWQGVLAARLAVDAERFQITSDSLRTSLTTAGGVASTGTSSRGQQTEVTARVFLDAEVLRFAGFVPGLTGGADVVLYRGDVASTSTVVPVLGAGVRRTSF